uniref:Uncharacterized protein n=1 Tax=Utricularia reniformis TaxID=192314 RepID=A0A1Y0AZX7_9LAMI|nr:hypothetical protein AEK19_MT0457 [Utricularia reniformis]ART30717.1 hypothetical protein AEK19_MT0457 [Utricularia reniformis]
MDLTNKNVDVRAIQLLSPVSSKGSLSFLEVWALF